jgi:atlastin
MWSEPFLIQTRQNEEVAVLLMDTQGLYDPMNNASLSFQAASSLFAFSLVCSSTQIYNLSHNIQMNDLKHLQLFADYCRVALRMSTTEPPYQVHFI